MGHQSGKVEMRAAGFLPHNCIWLREERNHWRAVSSWITLKDTYLKNHKCSSFVCLAIDLGYLMVGRMQFFFFFAVLCQLVLYIVHVIPESSVLSHVSPPPLSHGHLLGAPWSPQILLHSFCQKRLQTGSLWLTCTLQVCLFWPRVFLKGAL